MARPPDPSGTPATVGTAAPLFTFSSARCGQVMNAALSEYRIPVNPDLPDIHILAVDEQACHIKALGIKGVEEIGIAGVRGTRANAVYHSTGRRVRGLPMTSDEVL